MIIIFAGLLKRKQIEFVKIYDVSCGYPKEKTSSYRDFFKSQDGLFMNIIINCQHLDPVKVSHYVASV